MAHTRGDVASDRGYVAAEKRGLLAAVRDPIVWVFLLAGIFEVLTGDPIAHGTLLFVVAAALATDAVVRRAHRAQTPAHAPDDAPMIPVDLTPSRSIVTTGIVLYAIAGSTFIRYTWPMTFVVGVPAIAAVAWAWRVPERVRDPLHVDRLGAWLWIALFVALALWELRALLLQPSFTTGSDANPTISRLTDPILAVHSGRLVGLLIWLGLGRFLLGAASS